jgi:8-oxo-dGTP pyrophosphatase MutT (NUDIX family)
MTDNFDAGEFAAQAREKLRQGWPDEDFDPRTRPPHGDHWLNEPLPEGMELKARPAAVLAAVVLRETGAFLLLTQRAAHLRDHSGQIAFPGGKIEAGESPLDAALREAEEEIGLAREKVEILGGLDPYQTSTGFRVFPLVGLLRPPFDLMLDRREVAETFETPLSFLMNPANHQKHSRVWQGKERFFYAMPWQGRYIWGATAGMIRNFYDRLYG